MRLMLFRVTNGFIGNGDIHCLVIATDTESAKDLASGQFRKRAEEHDSWARTDKYGDDYWRLDRLEVETLCGDVLNPWVSEVDD